MENKSISSFTNALLITISIISLILGLLPTIYPQIKIDPQIRIILLVAAPVILALACFYIYLNKIDIILERIEKLEEKVKRGEDLITIKSDIEYLKRAIK